MNRLLVLALLLLVIPSVSAQDSGSGSISFPQNISDLRGYVEIESVDKYNRSNQTKIFTSEEGLNLPTGIITLILVFLGIMLYSVEMDPFWMVLLVLLLVFTGVVYYLSLPIHLIPIAIMLVMGAKYFR